MNSEVSGCAALCAGMKDRSQPVAVIGMALRAPGAETLEAYWANILAGRDTLTRPTEAQLRRSSVPESLIDDPRLVRAAPLLRDAGAFDPDFFSMSAREARMTDPAHRLFLTCVWEALERAGVIPGPEAGCVGVFGGTASGSNSYSYRIFGGGAADLDDPAEWLPVNVGGSPEHLTSRVCFKLDLQGPNMTVAAACATSLLAIHCAVRSLANGECELAVAGGANVMVPDWPAYLCTEGGPLSPSGVLRPFDARADGTIFGSGAGVLVLKSLDRAVNDGDHVYATILGSGICNDGGRKQSFTAPGSGGQTIAISRALADAQVSADTIGFVEAHGTATLVGDPIELQSTTDAFRADTARTRYCAMGSVKGNIGHTGGSAGVLGVIKACLALARRTIPPNTHFETPNPRLALEESPFYIPTEPEEWVSDRPRRAAVSSFGFGGNNAHLILEEAPALPARGPNPQDPADEVIVLSGRTPAALEAQIQQLSDHLDSSPPLRLDDVSHTLQTGRRAFEHRAAVVASTPEEACRRFRDTASVQRGRAGGERKVIFAFPGQGSQQPGMAQPLYREDAVYRELVDRCCDLLTPRLDIDLRDVLAAEGANADLLGQTAFAQPALFVVEYALAKRLLDCGVRPDAMIGHSVSELVAACLAGVFSLEDALALVAERGRLMQACAPGSMLAVFVPVQEVEPWLGDALEIAAINGPDVTVVSGPAEAVSGLAARLQAADISSRVLKTSHGFHSRSMEPAVGPFREAVRAVRRSEPTIPFVSGVTGELITGAEAVDPDYWGRHLRLPVQFAKGVASLQDLDNAVWIEVGPGRALASQLSRQTEGATIVTALENRPEGRAGFLSLLGRLWSEGLQVDWAQTGDRTAARRVPLPTYPFELKRYWIDPPPYRDNGGSQADPRPEPEAETRWLHGEDWRREPLRSAELRPDDGWLIFEDAAGLGARLRERLLSQGARVVSLVAGEDFEELASDRFAVRPANSADLLRVLTGAAESGWRPDRVLHLWELTDGEKIGHPLERLDDCLETGLETLVALVKALFASGLDESVDLTVAANRVLLAAAEQGPLDVHKATLVGPCRVTPLEMKSYSAQLIDVPSPGSFDERLEDALLAEAASPGRPTVKALRPDGRYLQFFSPVGEMAGSGGVRPGGVVLITGGAGGLGLECAERLFEMASMKLALLTRWQPPPEQEWDRRARSNDRIGRALRKVTALRERGAQVEFVVGDSADPRSMANAIEEVRARFGALHGVVHAAGIGRAELILEEDRDGVETVFSSKSGAALILEQLLGDSPLDFFISYSSIASVLPTTGQVDYAAANAVLDAQARRSTPGRWRRVCAISWDAWDEVGMAVDYASQRRAFQRASIARIPLGTGLDVLQEVLTADEVPAHVVVTSRPLESAGSAPPAAVGHSSAARGRRQSTDFKAPSTPVEEKIAAIWAQILAIEPIGVDDDFIELGGDSIASIQVLSRIRRELGVGLPQNAVLESGTVGRLAALIGES